MWEKQTNNITVLSVYYPEGAEFCFINGVFQRFLSSTTRSSLPPAPSLRRWLTFNYSSGPAGSSLR